MSARRKITESYSVASEPVVDPAASRRFYSALGRAIRHIKKIAGADGTIRPDQALAWLAARQRDGWFKLSELHWSGLEDWLKLKTQSVPVADIVDFVRDNGVELHEVMKGDAKYNGTGYDDATQSYAYFDTNGVVAQSGFDTERQAAEAMRAAPQYTDPTKYGQYVLPGGENYRELLLILATQAAPAEPMGELAELPAGYELGMDLTQGEGKRYHVIPPGQTHARPYGGWRAGTPEEARAGALSILNSERDNDARDVFRKTQARTSYTSGHWDESNIIAHIRFNTRSDAAGARVLFIEELQSDWGQAGLKKGFGSHSLEQSGQWWNITNQNGDVIDQQDTKERAEQVAAQMRDTLAAPFVTDTKAWLSLAIKRIVLYAVEHGYDRVAFVNGEQSVARYDLSKQIESVEYRQRTEGPKAGTGLFMAYNHAGNQVIAKPDVRNADLAEIVGKDVAERLMMSEGPGYLDSTDRAYVLSGEDLKVGGAGMKTFYDKIVPQTVNEVLKKLGGGRGAEVTIPVGDPKHRVEETADGRYAAYGADRHYAGTFDTKTAAETFMGVAPAAQFGFALTPALRASVEEGLPLFSRRPRSAKSNALDHAPQAARLGWAQPVSEHALGQRVSPNVEKLLRGGLASGDEAANGLDLLRDALQEIVESCPPELRALAAQVRSLWPHQGHMRLTVDDTARFNLNGAVTLSPDVHMTLFTADGRTGLTYETILHESLHVIVAARYRTLVAEAARLGAGANHQHTAATHAIEQFDKVWVEFKLMSGRDDFSDPNLQLAVAEARRSPDEFFVRALTDPIFQKYLSTREYDGKTLWQRFADWIRTSLFGAESPNLAPSWLDAALTASHDLADAMQRDPADFSGVREYAESMLSLSRACEKGSALQLWFGASKVVDEHSRPLVVFHGARNNADIEQFSVERSEMDRDEKGIYFTSSTEHANQYATNWGSGDAGYGGAMYPVYLKLTNPAEVTAEQWIRGEGMTPREAREAGHDGFIIWGQEGGDTYVVFRSDQIKSASGNRGDFDPRDPSILASMRALAIRPAIDHAVDEDNLDAAVSSARPG